MTIYYCNGKKDFCEDYKQTRCVNCEYANGEGGKFIELTPEQEKALQKLKKEEADREAAAAAWEEFKKPIRDILDKLLHKLAAFIDRIKKGGQE